MTPQPNHEMPLVSVLTPSFGQARWLPDNLESVSRQAYPLVEHIVMDGGSTDGTLAVLERHARPDLHWTSEPDRGQSHALNKAFKASRGDIVGWLNSDDAYFGPTAIADAVEVFNSDPGIAVVYGHAVLVNGDGLVLQVIWAPTFNRRLLRLHDFVVQPTAFVRRSALDDIMVDESFDYTMDYELWLRLARRGRFRRLDSIVAIDRHHLGRKSYTMADLGLSDHVRLQERYRVAGGAAGTVGRKLWKIGARFAGIRLVRDAAEGPVVFEATRDGRLPLLFRQIAVRRASMVAGG
jgi:glycosyltransferase involved in cell wall biosynthesis